MKKIFRILYICCVAASIACLSNRILSKEEHEYEEVSDEVIDRQPALTNWDHFISAVIWKESRGVEDCIGDNGKAVGVLQIHPVMVREANRILRMNGEDKEYSYDDRYSREKSIEIFNIVQDYHNKSHDLYKALEIWNKNHPESYRQQIMEKYNELISI